MITPPLTTKRLLIRPFLAADAADYQRISTAVGWVNPKMGEEALQQIRGHPQTAMLQDFATAVHRRSFTDGIFKLLPDPPSRLAQMPKLVRLANDGAGREVLAELQVAARHDEPSGQPSCRRCIQQR